MNIHKGRFYINDLHASSIGATLCAIMHLLFVIFQVAGLRAAIISKLGPPLCSQSLMLSAASRRCNAANREQPLGYWDVGPIEIPHYFPHLSHKNLVARAACPNGTWMVLVEAGHTQNMMYGTVLYQGNFVSFVRPCPCYPHVNWTDAAMKDNRLFVIQALTAPDGNVNFFVMEYNILRNSSCACFYNLVLDSPFNVEELQAVWLSAGATDVHAKFMNDPDHVYTFQLPINERYINWSHYHTLSLEEHPTFISLSTPHTDRGYVVAATKQKGRTPQRLCPCPVSGLVVGTGALEGRQNMTFLNLLEPTENKPWRWSLYSIRAEGRYEPYMLMQ